MASSLKNLSTYDHNSVPNAEGYFFGIVISEWNTEITNSLAQAAIDTLIKHGVSEKQIIIEYVPGTYELAYGAQLMLSTKPIDAVICVGCVIQGETRHFDFICDASANGIMQVGLNYNAPTIFSVLTTDTIEQAKDRSGGKHGNKGTEAAITAIKMVSMTEKLENEAAEESFWTDFPDNYCQN